MRVHFASFQQFRQGFLTFHEMTWKNSKNTHGKTARKFSFARRKFPRERARQNARNLKMTGSSMSKRAIHEKIENWPNFFRTVPRACISDGVYTVSILPFLLSSSSRLLIKGVSSCQSFFSAGPSALGFRTLSSQ